MTTLNQSPTGLDRGEAPLPGRSRRPDRADFDVVLEPRPGWRAVDFGELYRHRDLFIYWTLRNLKARHAQSALGMGWAVIQPVVNTVIFTVVFGSLVGVPSDGVPYPLFALGRHGVLDLLLQRGARGRREPDLHTPACSARSTSPA